MKRFLIPLTTFAVATAVSFLVARALAPGEEEAAETVAFDEPVVVVIPIPVDGDLVEAAAALATADTEARDAASAAGVALPEGSAASRPVIGGGRSLAELIEAEEAGGPPSPYEPGVGEPIPEASEEDVPPADLVVDLCAEEAPPFDCPDGIGGFVVFTLEALPPYDGTMSVTTYYPGTVLNDRLPQCEARSEGVGEALLGMSANRPSSIRLHVWTAAGDLVHDLVLTSSPAAVDRWHAWREEGSPSRDPRGWIQHCVVLEGLEPDGIYEALAIYTDTLETADTFRVPERGRAVFRALPEGGAAPEQERRPTVILPLHVDRMYVNATRTPGESLSVWAVEEGLPCDAGFGGPPAPPGVYFGYHSSTTEIPAERRRDPGYPYLPTHSVADTFTVDVAEGTNYLMCLAWWAGGGPTFAPERVVLTEAIPFATAEAYRVRVELVGFEDPWGALAGSQVDDLSLWVWPTWRANCTSYQADLRDGLPILLMGDTVLCPELTGVARMKRDGLLLESSIEGSEGYHQRTVRIAVDARCASHPCPIRPSEVALVPLPLVPTERHLCGSGHGSGCGENIPRRSVGTARLLIHYLRSEGNGAASFTKGEPHAFDIVPDLPPEPRLSVRTRDLPTSPRGALSEGVTVEVTVQADRPVTIGAEVVGPAGGAPCFAAGSPEAFAAATPATLFSFRFSGLCAGADYRIHFTGTDDEGNAVGVMAHTWSRPVPHYTFRTAPLTVPIRAEVVGMAHPQRHKYTAWAQLFVTSPAGSGEQHVDHAIDDAFRAQSARVGWTFDAAGVSACSRLTNRVEYVKPLRDEIQMASHEPILLRVWLIFRMNEEKPDGITEDERYTCTPSRGHWDSWELRRYVTLQQLLDGVTIESEVGHDGQYARAFVRIEH